MYSGDLCMQKIRSVSTQERIHDCFNRSPEPRDNLQKTIHAAPKRLQRMRLRLQKYHVVVKYQPGMLMYISDTLSRAPLNTRESDETRNYDIFQLDQERSFEEELEKIDYREYCNVTDEKLQRIATHTARDETLKQLMDIVMTGWPISKEHIPLDYLGNYFRWTW